MDIFSILIPASVFGIFILIMVLSIGNHVIKQKKIKALLNMNSEKEIRILNNYSKDKETVGYFRYIFDNSFDSHHIWSNYDIAIEGKIIDETVYFMLDIENGVIKQLADYKSNNLNFITFNLSDIKQVKLRHKTWSETRGTGKNRSTYYYNGYYTDLIFNDTQLPVITIYARYTQVGSDKGLLEAESRVIGELFAKHFEIPLERIDGTMVEHDKLDDSILEKIDEYQKETVYLKKEYFMSTQTQDGYLIGKFKYRNWGILITGIIILGLTTFFVPLFFIDRINNIVNLPYNDPKYTSFIFYGLIGLLTLGLWKISKNNPPRYKIILLLTNDSLITHPKFNNTLQASGKISIKLDNIEEIVVRYEKSKGYVVKAVSDDLSVSLFSFADELKAKWIRNEILSILKELNF